MYSTMKRLYSISVLMLATASWAQQAGENISIGDYFSSTLAGTAVNYENDAAIELEDIATARDSVWNIWRESVNALDEEKLFPIEELEYRKSSSWTLPQALEPNAVMPFYWGCNEFPMKGDGKYPLFVYMHGSGDKAQEWETGIGLSLRRFYSPAVYFVPQIPNAYGEYYRWAIQSKQWAWEKLLRLSFLEEAIDANKIYFFGISEGAYGSQRLASFYADYLAGTGPMAGGEPLKNAPMENVANIAFSLRTGELDTGFGRNILTAKALEVADSLQREHPAYYNHYIEVIPGDGHSIDYRPTTPWLAQYTRDPHPDYFYWENFAMYGRQRTGFYNLKVNTNATTSSTARACYEHKREGNTIELNVNIVNYITTYSTGGIDMFFRKKYSKASRGNVTIYLSEKEFDLSSPVKVILNGTEIFNGMVGASLQSMVESCALFYDPERLFPAAIEVDVASKSAIPTSVESVNISQEEINDGNYIYDLCGRRVESPVNGGVYIMNGKVVVIK